MWLQIFIKLTRRMAWSLLDRSFFLVLDVAFLRVGIRLERNGNRTDREAVLLCIKWMKILVSFVIFKADPTVASTPNELLTEPFPNHPERPKTVQLACGDSVGVWSAICAFLRTGNLSTHPRQFRYHDSHQRQEVDAKVCEIVVCVVGAQQEQHDRDCEEELLRRSVLITVVDLLPHV